MASAEALSIQREKHINRIEAWALANVGEGLTPLPRVHKDPIQHSLVLVSTIADWLDRAVLVDDTLQQARELVQSGNWTKADMEALLLGESGDGDSSTDN